jgi:hypothetical protein
VSDVPARDREEAYNPHMPVQDAGKQNPVFEIGLALAGAISAGAYSPSVIDFIYQALSEWETRRGGS